MTPVIALLASFAAASDDLPLAPDPAPEPAPAPVPAEPAPAPAPPPAVPAPAPPPPPGENPWRRGKADPATPASSDVEPGENPWRRGKGSPGMRWYGASLGAYAGGTLGYVTDDEATIIPLTLLTGAAGYGMVWGIERLRPEWRPTGDDVALFYTASSIGAFTGIEAARALVPVGDQDEYERIAGAGVLGALLGMGISLAANEAPPARLDLALGLGALAGWQGAAGAMGIAGLETPEDRQILAAGELGGAALIGVASAAYAGAGGKIPSAGQVALDLGHGAWVGLWLPVMAGPNDGIDTVHGMRVGLAAGYGLALATAPFGRSSPRSVALQGAGIAVGSALGAGIPLALGYDTDEVPAYVLGPMLAGGVGGQLIGAAVAPSFEADSGDGALLGLAGGWGLYQTVAWAALGSELTGDASQSAGFALTAAGGSTLVGVGLVPLVDLAPAEVAMTGSAGLWGTWSGAWGAWLVGAEPDAVWASTLIGGNVALVATGGVLATDVTCDWADVALIDGLGAAGGATGALFGVVASPSSEVIGGASLVGTTAGLVTGAVIAGRSPPSSSDALALDLGRARWVPHLGTRPWVDHEGNQGVWVSLDARESRSR